MERRSVVELTEGIIDFKKDEHVPRTKCNIDFLPLSLRPDSEVISSHPKRRPSQAVKTETRTPRSRLQWTAEAHFLAWPPENSADPRFSRLKLFVCASLLTSDQGLQYTRRGKM